MYQVDEKLMERKYTQKKQRIAALYRSHGATLELASHVSGASPDDIENWEMSDPEWMALSDQYEDGFVWEVYEDVLQDLTRRLQSRPLSFRTVGQFLAVYRD